MRDEDDFSASKRGAIIKTAKERITIRLDPDIIEWFRTRVQGGGNYQTLINEALREHIERQSGADLETTLRRVLREELKSAKREIALTPNIAGSAVLEPITFASRTSLCCFVAHFLPCG